VFAGDSEGRVHVLDPRTQEPVNILQVWGRSCLGHPALGAL
jgi:hypothetical protein